MFDICMHFMTYIYKTSQQKKKDENKEERRNEKNYRLNLIVALALSIKSILTYIQYRAEKIVFPDIFISSLYSN